MFSYNFESWRPCLFCFHWLTLSQQKNCIFLQKVFQLYHTLLNNENINLSYFCIEDLFLFKKCNLSLMHFPSILVLEFIKIIFLFWNRIIFYWCMKWIKILMYHPDYFIFRSKGTLQEYIGLSIARITLLLPSRSRKKRIKFRNQIKSRIFACVLVSCLLH